MGAGGVFSIGSSASTPVLRLNYAGSEWPSAHYVSRSHRSTCVRVHALIVGRGWGSRRRWQRCAIFSEFFGFLEHTLLVRPHMRLPRCAHCVDLQSRTR